MIENSFTENGVSCPCSTTENGESNITIVGDDSTGTAINLGQDFQIAGGTGISTSVSGDVLTITADEDQIVNSLESSDSTEIIVKDSISQDAVWWGDVNLAFDPNKFVHGISQKDWDALIENKKKPLINKLRFSNFTNQTHIHFSCVVIFND